MLECLGRTNTLPWICMDDFNEIFYADETIGGNSRPERQMDRFRMVLNRCYFQDLGFIGPRFTWHKLFADGRSIQSRLDRALASTSWVGKFSNAKLYHISNFASDHCILSLRLGLVTAPFRNQAKQFRFEVVWLQDPNVQRWFRRLGREVYCPIRVAP